MCRRRKKEPINDGIQRTNVPTRQMQSSAYPMSQVPSQAMPMPNTGAFHVAPNGMPMGLPTYSSVDEYGRVYTPIMHYGPQPVSAPMPIAKPAEFVQLAPIVSPVAFVPFSAQEDKQE
ncbi:MAG TPA: hypothetical protein GX709_00180 [Clostridiales bacterium]|nr:hypothetical protein [Clostridiales bacterium]